MLWISFFLNWQKLLMSMSSTFLPLHFVFSCPMVRPTQAKIQMINSSGIFTIGSKSFNCTHYVWWCTRVTNPFKEEVNTFFCLFLILCFPAVNKTWSKLTLIIFKWLYCSLFTIANLKPLECNEHKDQNLYEVAFGFKLLTISWFATFLRFKD